jgi:DNA-directed RNA polymerase subunit RPC12/RpoP
MRKKHEYICLACGNYYLMVSSSMGTREDTKCPQCLSSNVMEVSSAQIFKRSGSG